MPRLEQLARIVQEANTGLASFSDVKKLFDGLTTFVRDAKAELTNKVATNKAEMDKEMSGMYDHCDDNHKDVSAKIAKLESDLRSDIRTTTRMFEQNVKDLRDEIPEEYEDTELRRELARIEGLIPQLYDDSTVKEEIEELEDDIEKLEKDIEELKKRPIGKGGGGTSALGVAHTFKYIAHTEQPVGDIDGVNTTYTVKNNIWWIAGFTLNGEQVAELPNFTYSGKTITFSSAIPAAFAGKDIECKYIGT